MTELIASVSAVLLTNKLVSLLINLFAPLILVKIFIDFAILRAVGTELLVKLIVCARLFAVGSSQSNATNR